MVGNRQVPLWARSLMLVRKADRNVALRLEGLVQACAAFGSQTALCYRIEGRKALAFGGTRADIEHALVASRRAAARGTALPLVLATDSQNPLLTLTYTRDRLSPGKPYDRVEIAFNLDRPLVGPGGYFTFEELVAFFDRCIGGYQVATGAIYDSQLLEIVTSTIVREEMMRELPPEQHRYIPVSPVVQAVPADLVRRLAHLRHPSTFDITEVPEAVFWINYWNPRQIAAVGEEAVKTAPWALVEPHSDGGLILATQREPFDALNPDDLDRLACIADALDLYRAQTKYATSG